MDNIPEIGKPQVVRLWDVFFLGPFLVWGGMYRSRLPKPARAIMVVSGVLTIWYNGRNYLRYKDSLSKAGNIRPFSSE